MSKKKNKKNKLEKTLVEKILDQNKIKYRQSQFAVSEDKGGVAQMNTSILEDKERLVYKTLVCEGNKTGPLVGVVPVTEHLSMKKLAKVSGNKKCEMLQRMEGLLGSYQMDRQTAGKARTPWHLAGGFCGTGWDVAHPPEPSGKPCITCDEESHA